MADVTVIGAGVAGLTCALALAERGASVEVIDRGERLGAEACSWYAGGMLAPWCERESAEPLVAELGEEAIDYWAERVPGVMRKGTLVVAPARDVPDLARFARRTERFGWVDGERIATLEPDLAGRFSKGLFFSEEGHLDPRDALDALSEALARQGISIRFGVEVENEAPSSPTIVDCRGFGARDALPDLRGVKGEMVLVRTKDVTLSRPVRLLHPRHPVYIVPRDDGLFMIGATMIESSERGRVTARAMLELLGAAYAVHPAFAEAEIIEIGADVRPAFPDNLPRISRRGRTFHVNGLFRHGFLLAPALARRVAATVLHGTHYPEVMDEDQLQR
ncbi:glycine oxidase ThiO [Rubellimicrobium roseum]|uniref:glycine oxidase ThiO n=1 Tax=Rubellimicrobium roseum TaxID=687525 RepID=UPI001C3F1617|nr:glycine oxidase ThiO [Rubellimicrobium roseum]